MPPGATFAPQMQRPRRSLTGSRHAKKPILCPFSWFLLGLLTGLTAFRNEYLPPQVHLGKSAFG